MLIQACKPLFHAFYSALLLKNSKNAILAFIKVHIDMYMFICIKFGGSAHGLHDAEAGVR